MYNDLTAIVTKIELTGTEKLFTLLMKWFVSFIYEGICFPRAGDGDQRISKFLMCYTQLNFIIILGYLHTQQVSLMLFLRYISFIHIYSWSWTHGQEKLRLSLEDLNKWHPNIKFTHETNKEDIAFLDLKVKLYWTVKYLQICLLNLQTVTNFSITHLLIQYTPRVQ